MTDASRILPPTTAGIHPERFSDELEFLSSRLVTAIILGLLVVVAFGFRMNQLAAESFGEDEYNKLQTVEEYRQNGLSGKNGEHPFLMKGLQTLSISAADKLNSSLTAANPISSEAALRFPVALFGTFTTLLLFLLVRELFGRSIALTTAALWAVEPMAIGFDRVAKEDSLALFFFLVTAFLVVRSQTVAERGGTNYMRYMWGAAAGFAGLMASKYNPWLLAIPAGYYGVFDYLKGRRKWSVGKPGWLMFFAIMGVTFLIVNPTVLLPDTWREMLKFSSENRIGHDSYEFWGKLYPNKMSLWFNGVPASFYYVFIAVKTSLPVLLLMLAGIPLLFRRRMGDGRFFIAIWAFVWFMPFSVLGGKFTRYFAIPEPLLLITAATAFYYGVKWISSKLRMTGMAAGVLQAALFLALVIVPAYDSFSVGPHYRMFTNSLGGGMAAAGRYFPHDEFYDAASEETVRSIAAMSPGPAKIACETPYLFDHYADRIGRPDLKAISLSDPQAMDNLAVGDFVVLTSGRRYFSNEPYERALVGFKPDRDLDIAGASASRIYRVDEQRLAAVRAAMIIRN
jgi:hypothetical protein